MLFHPRKGHPLRGTELKVNQAKRPQCDCQEQERVAPGRVHAIPGEDLESMRADVPLMNIRGMCAYGGQVVKFCIGWRGGMHLPNEEMHI